MRMPPLLADFIYNRVCELKCEKFLTRPNGTLDIYCGCGNLKAPRRRPACLYLKGMAEFYVGGTGKENATYSENSSKIF